MASAETHVTRLSSHTLESLCIELANGRSIQLDDQGNTFSLATPDTQAVFDWYRLNRKKWGARNTKEDVESIVARLDKPAPTLRSSELGTMVVPKKLFVDKVRVHRFAGIQQYCGTTKPPPAFLLDVPDGIVILEGANGSGKTSLASALTWGFNGHIYRAQRPPERIESTFAVGLEEHHLSEVVDEEEGPETTGNDQNDYDIAAITPLPSAEVLRQIGNAKIPLDTMVHIELVDEQGRSCGSIQRKLSRTSRGALQISQPDFGSLGVSPIALEIGTLMPGALPYIQPGTESNFGQAVASLTGLRPLADLVVHAKRSIDKLNKDLPKERAADIAVVAAKYDQELRTLTESLDAHQELQTLQRPSAFKVATVDDLAALKSKIDGHITTIYQGARKHLNRDIDANVRNELETNVGPAVGYLAADHIAKLAGQKRIEALTALDEADLGNAESLLHRIAAEAREIEELSKQPALASRLRLYARVARWLKESDAEATTHNVSSCPVCSAALEGRIDPVSQTAISAHLATYLKTDARHIEETLDIWQSAAAKDLRSELPRPILDLIDHSVPTEPYELLQSALSELFATRVFQGSLTCIFEAANKRLDHLRQQLPTFDSPSTSSVELPTGLTPEFRELIATAQRGLLIARWMRNNEALINATVPCVVGTIARETKLLDELPTPISIVDALSELLRKSGPLRNAKNAIDRLIAHVNSRDVAQKRIASYKRTAAALVPLLKLNDLIDLHAGNLISTLSAETRKWKEMLYVPACAGAPSLRDADVASDGVLRMGASLEGTRAEAQHITNASELRAALLAFLFALHRHVLSTQGGIAVFVLDDIQELFDSGNRRRLAETICKLADDGTQVLVTTNDETFRRTLASAAASAQCNCLQKRVAPPTKTFPVLRVVDCIEVVHQKRHAFLKPMNVNNHSVATDYANSLRMFLECLLGELLSDAAQGMAIDATLADFVNALKGLRTSAIEPFQGEAVRRLVEWPQWGKTTPFMRVLNESHHRAGVKYEEVKQIDRDATWALRLVEAAHHEYLLWLKRVPPEDPNTVPAFPPPIAAVPSPVPLFYDLAAFTSSTPTDDTLEEHGHFGLNSLGQLAVYWLRTWNLGFAARSGWRVLVSLEHDAANGGLVVALHGDRVYARRLHVDPARPSRIALSSEAEDPTQRPPTLFLKRSEVRLLPVVGVIFDGTPFFSRNDGEAVLEAQFKGLQQLQIAFRVRGESAEPLALDGQLVLGGPLISPDQFLQSEGEIVAVCATGESVLKRIGPSLTGLPNARLLEAVGGRGESVAIRLEDIEDDPLADLPVMQSARRVLGVVYACPTSTEM